MLRFFPLLCVLWLSGIAFADETDKLIYKTSVAAKKPVAVGVRSDELIDQDTVHLSRKMGDLEGRITALERESRFQDERIRNLDRQVTDLKRRK